MKKDLKAHRKLSLTTETLKSLNPTELDQANGGATVTVVPIVLSVMFCFPQKAH